jgi:two-component system CheB/CheR fusion protein
MNKENGSFASVPAIIPIVGIGSSAGGLEALKRFFEAMPDNSGMAFVVVTHHDPMQVSHLPDILRKHASMPVVEVSDSKPIVANHIYVCLSAYPSIENGSLHCQEAVSGSHISLPIDFFFRSLAERCKDRAIAIVLSGTGSDGTLGVKAIKGEGGMAMAQEAKSAQFSDMPVNAMNTGLIDYILLPEAMPERLVTYAQRLSEPGKVHTQQLPQALGDILGLLRQHTGNDFSNYKTNTLVRRIERRMNVHHISEPKYYVRYLAENVHEIDMLFRELLIGVTSFFRDAAAFEVLAEQALPLLLDEKAEGDNVRVWVPGCSTGEEAYTLAIIFHEYMMAQSKAFNIQIFATDLDEKSITHARNGIYTEGIALDVSSERLQRHFNHEDNHYQIKKHLREMVVFATQNLAQDPPFTKLDLISCRNLLIYLDAKLQRRIIPLFHYSLRPGGILFLGSSETVGTFAELFDSVQSRWKILKRKEVPLSVNRLTRFTEFPRFEELHTTSAGGQPRREKVQDITELAQKLLLKAHIPPSIIVNEKGNLFFIHGRTGMYLEPPPGPPQPQANVLDMARDGLQLALAAIIRKAASQDNPVTHTDVNVKTNGHYTNVTLKARKIAEPEALRGMIWVTFETDGEEAEHSPSKKAKAKKPQPAESDQLERELHFIKQNLQSTIEELEAANEELKSTNEELQSTNEELQSANEELETAKEEMQSLNEELQTVNIELESKIRDLSFANDDMKNLLNSTGIATLFLDNSLNILRFTNQAKRLINLIQTDIGRPISDIVVQLEYDSLLKDATEVLQTLVFKEIEVRARDWSWYLMRIMPYRTAENVIEGLVITFVDITTVKKSEILLATQKSVLELIVKDIELSKILDKLLLTIESYSSGIWCSISLLSNDSKTLRHGAAPSLPDAFNEVLDGIQVKSDALEPCAQAVYQRRSVMIPDMVNDVAPTAFHELALKYDIQACWAQPIYSGDGKVVGTFTTYYKQAHQPSDIEEALINQTMPLMGLAIDHHREAKT